MTKNKLFVIWASADTEVHKETSFQYSFNAKKYGWMDEVKVIIFGPSERTIPENPELMNKIKLMIDNGIEVIACKACGDGYSTSKKFEEIGVKIEYVGKYISDLIKDGWHHLSF